MKGRGVTVRIAGETLTGRAIDLRDSGLDAATATDALATAIRGDSGATATDSDASVATEDPTISLEGATVSIDCPRPGPAHDHVGAIRTGMDFRLRSALAAAARSRGHAAPQADELAAVRDRLDSLDAPEIDLQRARRRVADASDAEAELRERVATLQGRVQALREGSGGPDVEDAETELAEATRRLSEVETERIAAEQALARAREQAQANRERRRERLRLQDRADNLRRAARERLAETVREAFVDARELLPADTDAADGTDDVNLGESVRDALAVARVAELHAPVVLDRDADPFGSAEAAARWLDGPVLRI